MKMNKIAKKYIALGMSITLATSLLVGCSVADTKTKIRHFIHKEATALSELTADDFDNSPDTELFVQSVISNEEIVPEYILNDDELVDPDAPFENEKNSEEQPKTEISLNETNIDPNPQNTDIGLGNENLQPADDGSNVNNGQNPSTEGTQVAANEVLPQNAMSDGELQIVYLGDSIFDFHRDGTGIPYLTSEALGASCYNLAMGGTTASLPAGESEIYSEWTSRCMLGVILSMCGLVDPSIMDGYVAGDVFKTCDFSKTDYFVIEYGINDYFSKVPLYDENNPFNCRTYCGAEVLGINLLQQHFPNAKIVLCSPSYVQFWSNNVFIGDGNVVSNGVAVFAEYHWDTGNTANACGTLYFNAYDGIELNAYTAEDYLEDGIHLTEPGRAMYADYLSNFIYDDLQKDGITIVTQNSTK